jgi:hypothetical protein
MSTLSLPETETDVPIVTSQSLFSVPSAGSTWTGLSALSDTVAISSLASGRVSLHRAGEAAGAEAAGVIKVGKPVLTLSAPDSANNTFAMAGKEMEIGVWDVERAFVPKGSKTLKRKKDSDLMPGEIWRAKNVAHNNLQLRVPVHHLCSAFLPGSTSDIVTGTKAGNVRRYDTRQRKPTADWKLAREGGIAAIAAGAEHEVFFADHSNLVGALDLRTGKMLYAIPGLTASAHFLLPLPAPQPKFSRAAGLATVSSDATLRVCGTTPPPIDLPKGNWATGGKKGSVVGAVGGVGVANAVFRRYGSHVADKAEPKEKKDDDEESDDDAEVDEDEEEEIWEGMGDAEEGSDEEMDEDDESSEDEAPKQQKRRK